MAVLQELGAGQINELIQAAGQRNVPMIVTIRSENTWANLHSRALSIRGSHLLLEMPVPEEGAIPHEFVPAERIGVSFKLKHHKHIFAGTVAGQERVKTADGTEIPALAIVMPTRMQRLQRRAYIRVDVPANRVVRASFWLGGCDSEPAGTSPEHPVWYGRVMNISAGGFQLETDQASSEHLEPGDKVGMRLVFGASGETIYADAQFRHKDEVGLQRLLGFQFLGLTETPEGRVVLQVISAKVSEFQRIASRPEGYKHN